MSDPNLGVVIVTFNSEDVILDCLESLLASNGVALTIVVVDNASEDTTVALLQDWAEGRHVYAAADEIPFPLQACAKPIALNGTNQLPKHSLTLLQAGQNAGFAAGVNIGLEHLAALPAIDRFWVLNPDSLTPPLSAHAFATHPTPAKGFALMGSRVLYLDRPGVIQIDGGTINRRTGITGNIGLGAAHLTQPAPDSAHLDFVMGASMVASRQFYERAGPMPEDYFLYYEEVDWALRRGDLPLVYCPGGIVYHRAGTAIGSATLNRPASAFSLYFKHRARMRFMRRYFPRAMIYAYGYSIAKAVQLLLKGYPVEARTLLGASFGRPPSAAIRARLSAEAAKLAFGPER
jgi:GT2 family glycosyltransferase